VNKSELINALAEKTAFSKKDAEKALNAFVDTINGALSKGEKVQLIGFDDIMWANLFTPALTTISQPIHRIATRAMELIMDEEFSISNKKGVEIVYPVKLTVRETTRKKGS
jgi:DNA-binding LacI/PurR family transcriptional regulator